MPDWYDPGLFGQGTGVKGDVGPNPGYGDNPNGTAGDVLGALGTGLGILSTVTNPVTAPAMIGLLGYSMQTGKAPTISNAVRSLTSSLFGKGNTDTNEPGGLGSGQIEINSGNAVGDPVGGVHELGDITGGATNSMSGYAKGGRIAQHPMGALARGLLNHPNPAIGAMARAIAVHHALHGRRAA